MGHMAVSQNMVVGAYDRLFAIPGSAVDRDVFAKRVPVANLSPGHAAAPFQILRLQANAREGKNLIPFPQARVAIHHHMRM